MYMKVVSVLTPEGEKGDESRVGESNTERERREGTDDDVLNGGGRRDGGNGWVMEGGSSRKNVWDVFF